MAASAQALENCTEQKRPDNGDHLTRSGYGTLILKNGAAAEEIRFTKEAKGNFIVNNKVRSPNKNPENSKKDMIMENFQHGGRSTSANISAEHAAFNANLERPRINSEFQTYNQTTRESVLPSDEYRNPQDNVHHGSVSNYVRGYVDRTGGSYPQEQHGGTIGSGSSDDGNLNSQLNHNNFISQLNQQSRVGFSHSSRMMNFGSLHPSRLVSSASAMGGYPSSASSQQNRFLSSSDQNVGQQGGPTPTLNQLLQVPNSIHHYQNNYGDFGRNQEVSKGVGELANITSQYPGVGNSNNSPIINPSWNNLQNVNPYQQTSNSFHNYRNQDTADVPLDSGGRESGNTTPVLRAPSTPPTSQVQSLLQRVSPLRPVPSPSGSSTGSRSMSPAVGNQQSLPMPPRPSSQSDGSGCNKMNPLTMGSQSNYPRPLNSLGMTGYGGPSKNSCPPSASGAVGQPSASRVINHVPVLQNFGVSPGSGYVNSQYSSGPPQQGYAANNMMPPPNQYRKGSGTPLGTGPQAAAQAAMIAAANTVNSRPPAVHVRQHIQQKMYGNAAYSNMHSPQHQQPHQGIPASMALPATSSTLVSQTSPHQMVPSPSSGNCSSSSVLGLNIPNNQEMSSVGPLPSSGTPSSQSLIRNHNSPMSPAAAVMNGTNSSSPGGAGGFNQTLSPSIVTTSTVVTQSISSPVTSSTIIVSGTAVIPTEGGQHQHQVAPSMMSQHHQPPGRCSFGANPPPILDEGSQASNASGSSSLPDERGETPKPNHKTAISHPPTPNPLSSPNTTSMSSFQDDFESAPSPGWPRTPSSPVVNSHGYEYNIKRPDGLLKLYDISDEPERHAFLDKLIMFNEERGTPLSQCPTISKQPLDLYRLYLTVKTKGGFFDVTKSKHWKDVAGCVGIGASSSAAYTLRKQYIKHLLPFECKFDRGGVDPQPIVQQAEIASRKKNKSLASSSNVQEPFPHTTSSSQPTDGFLPGNYLASFAHPGQGASPSPMPNSEFSAHGQNQLSGYPQGPPHSNHLGTVQEGGMSVPPPVNMQYQHRSMPDSYSYSQPPVNAMGPAYRGGQSMTSGGSYSYNSNSSHDQFREQYGSQPSMISSSEGTYRNRNIIQDNYNSFPPSHAVGPQGPQYSYQGPYERERYEHQLPAVPQPSSQPGSMMGPTQNDPALYPSRYHNQQLMPQNQENIGIQPGSNYQGQVPSGPTPSQTPFSTSGLTEGQTLNQGQYVQGQQGLDNQCNYQMPRIQSALAQRLMPKNPQNMYIQGVTSPNKMSPTSGPPRDVYQQDTYGKRTPEFMRPPPSQPDQYHIESYGHDQTQGSYGDRNHFYRGSQTMIPPNTGMPSHGWPRDSHYRHYPSQAQYPPARRDAWDGPRLIDGSPSGATHWGMSPYPSGSGVSMVNKLQYGQDRMSYQIKKMPPYSATAQASHYPTLKKEIIFPINTVEGVVPVLTKRRRLTPKDVSPVDPWRIMMSLKSGLLGESTWALDTLSVLLYDDNSLLYFGLSHLPGLLEVLLEHYRRCLNLIFGLGDELEMVYDVHNYGSSDTEVQYPVFEHDSDCSKVQDCSENSSTSIKDKMLILKSENYTKKTRWGRTVGSKQANALFVMDSEKTWDFHEGFDSGTDHWKCGGGNTTSHIQTHFENLESFVKFVQTEDKSIITSKKNREQLNDEVICDLQDIDNKDNIVLNCQKEHVIKDSLNVDVLQNQLNMKSKDTTQNFNPEHMENIISSYSCEKQDKEMKIEQKMKNCKDQSNANVNDDSNKTEKQTIRIRPSLSPRKRHSDDCDLEKETYNRDKPSLFVLSDGQETLSRRCLCLSNLIRNLSFVPGNDLEMSKHAGLLVVLGKLILLHHTHLPHKPSQQHYNHENDKDNSVTDDSCSSLNGDQEWWWDMLHLLRENTLVTLANIAGQLNLAPFPEEVSLPILNGLLHWAVCPSSYAQDPLPTQPIYSVLSPQRLSLEALCKISVRINNVDLLLATPPWSRLEKFFSFLAQSLSPNKEHVLREFSVVLLSSFAQADSSIARAIALQDFCISNLFTFVEQAEQSALQVANRQGINALRENPELMGTTLEKVRRAASTLRCLSRVPENKGLFKQHQQRLLNLVMSQILDQGVASIIADVLYECSQDSQTSNDVNSLGFTVS
ncbi:trithorax group protein osa-like isoform X3 [Limulus polyphemus]|uniref:Trithorax group protein osa-like isoform X3 n=1 Tax=Limulus polyphemus TaxID=6850 RepID=A0ABM1S735_LIMPO|nr:trithorax group protein osa-like isoform X3 [Limulus polyphemus]